MQHRPHFHTPSPRAYYTGAPRFHTTRENTDEKGQFFSISPLQWISCITRSGTHYLDMGRQMYLMPTLNTTPDSFSDGDDHFSLTAATSYLRSAVEAGTDILDIGGYSTRPGSGFITRRRNTPVIQAIRRTYARS